MSAHKATVLTAFLCTVNELNYQLHGSHSLQQSDSSLTQPLVGFLTAGVAPVTLPTHTAPTRLLLFTELPLPLSLSRPLAFRPPLLFKLVHILTAGFFPVRPQLLLIAHLQL